MRGIRSRLRTEFKWRQVANFFRGVRQTYGTLKKCFLVTNCTLNMEEGPSLVVKDAIGR